MGTAILQRGLRYDTTSSSHPTSPPAKSHKNHNPNPNPSPTATRRRNRAPAAASQDRDRGRRDGDRSCVVVKNPGTNLVMGQVKILKRGEKLSPEPPAAAAAKKKIEGGFDSVLGTTDRFGPEPEMVQKQVRVPDLKDASAMFAGPTSLVSPPPSSVPVPIFLKRENLAATACDLMQLLRVVN